MIARHGTTLGLESPVREGTARADCGGAALSDWNQTPRSSWMAAIRLTIGIGLIVASALTLAASPFGAALKGSPFEKFTDADYEMFFASSQQAANGPLGEVKEWSNAKSGAHGTVKAVRNYKRDDADCRELRGQSSARGRTEPFRLAICKEADGKWHLVPFEPSAKPVPPPAPAAAPPAAETPRP
jgi:surface antigen